MSVGKDLKAFPRSGRPKTKGAPRKVAGALRRVKAAPNKSLRQVAMETGSTRSTVQRVSCSAGTRSLRLLKRPLLIERDQGLRIERCRRILKNLNLQPPAGSCSFWTRKPSTLTLIIIRKMIALYASRRTMRGQMGTGPVPGTLPVVIGLLPRPSILRGPCFLALYIASTGEGSPPVWWPGVYRLNADGYIKAMRTKIIPWMQEVAKKHAKPFIYQQDSAPCHIAKKTTAFF